LDGVVFFLLFVSCSSKAIRYFCIIIDLDYQQVSIGSDVMSIKVLKNAKVADDFWRAIANNVLDHPLFRWSKKK
jgi:hypothetical protein